tara:strand:- start:83 stop:706 length:624 start_codon:yes stop_codon:yes gene_type:complete
MSTTTGWKAIELSELAKAAIAALKEGTVLAVRMRNVTSSDDNLPKVQIEFAEKINDGIRVKTAASMFNALDSRFSSGAQRVWETADLAIAEAMFGSMGDSDNIEILKPMETINGEDFRIQLTEDVESSLTEKEAPYRDNYLKRKGKEGDYFYTPSGERVISRKRLVQITTGTNPVNTYLEGVYRGEGHSAAQTASKPGVAADILAGG